MAWQCPSCRMLISPSPTPLRSPLPAVPALPAPQVLAVALGWMAEAIPDFGLAVMDVKSIIEWMKADLGSANAPGG